MGNKVVDDTKCPKDRPTRLEDCNVNVPCPCSPSPVCPSIEENYCDAPDDPNIIVEPWTGTPVIVQTEGHHGLCHPTGSAVGHSGDQVRDTGRRSLSARHAGCHDRRLHWAGQSRHLVCLGRRQAGGRVWLLRTGAHDERHLEPPCHRHPRQLPGTWHWQVDDGLSGESPSIRWAADSRRRNDGNARIQANPSLL